MKMEIVISTVIGGLGLFTIMILAYELARTRAKLRREVDELCRQPMQKPVEVGELTRPVWIKSAPLHRVIEK
jgi:hypothetical protein